MFPLSAGLMVLNKLCNLSEGSISLLIKYGRKEFHQMDFKYLFWAEMFRILNLLSIYSQIGFKILELENG